MKNIKYFVLLFGTIFMCLSLGYSQSFYKSKDQWQHIVDTSWGQGLPLTEKLHIFDTYTESLTTSFAGFNALGISPSDWDSIKASYRSRISESTSRGAFSAIMSHLSYSLCDAHGVAYEELENEFKPGYPVVEIGKLSNHLGVVLTVLPDSSMVVLRSIENHPLDLQRGDIVLGYEGVPWRELIDELLAADLPLNFGQKGAKSARRHSELLSVGNNWHLFDTIDIVKYSTGDTLHLPVSPLLNLPKQKGNVWEEGPRENVMWNNEQLPVPGVPMLDPNNLDTNCLSYGIVEGTNIGYIYLYVEYTKGDVGIQYNSWDKFYEAFKSLEKTDGLIIDLRHNHGGIFPINDKTFRLMFNETIYTLEVAYRCNSLNFSLCPDATSKDYFVIPGDPMTLYDRPLAILIGPSTVSAGEGIAQELRYHPMVNFFGKSTPGSIMSNIYINDFPGWRIAYSFNDCFHVNSPGEYLDLKEFPVDVPVWFNADDVANGIDPVVEKALEWMQNLSYAHDVSFELPYIAPGTGTASINAHVENPQSHSISVKAFIKDMNGSMIDSTEFFDDGNHNDGSAADGQWGTLWPATSNEEMYIASVSTKDTDAGSKRTLPDVARFTTIGPVTLESYSFYSSDTTFDPGDRIEITLTLKNNGSNGTAPNIVAKIISLDTLVGISVSSRLFGYIAPGENSTSSYYRITISEKWTGISQVPILVEISSNDYVYWKDTLLITVQGSTSIKEMSEPVTRIYPNPTEDIINIETENLGQQALEIEVLTVTGSVIYKKIYENTNAHFTGQIDLSGFTKGIYLVKVRQANAVYVRKVVVR